MKNRWKQATAVTLSVLLFMMLITGNTASTRESQFIPHNNKDGFSKNFVDAVHEAFPPANGYMDIVNLKHYKDDNPGSTGTYPFSFVIKKGSSKAVIDWSAPSGYIVYYVFIKSGTGGVLYAYKNGATSDTGLKSPNSSVSHLSFYYGLVQNTPAPTKWCCKCKPTPTPTDVPTPTPTDVPTPTPTDVPTPTPTDVPTPTPTDVPTPTPTDVPTPTPTVPIEDPTIPLEDPTPTADLPNTGGADPTTLYLAGLALLGVGLWMRRRRPE